MSDVGGTIPNLVDYDVSPDVGFLLPNPLTELPPYFDPWTLLARDLIGLIERHELRTRVNEMVHLSDYESQLSTEEEENDRQLKLAYIILTSIGSGYIRQEENNPATAIPPQLAIPWHGISTKLELKPVPCMANVSLYNYQIKDPNKPLSLGNMEPICQYPGSRWFFLVTTQVELEAVKGIKGLLKAKEAVLNNDVEALCQAISEVMDSLNDIKRASSRMGEELDGTTFYNTVRPFLSGYEGRGILFEGVSDTPIQAIGGSAAQSSTIQSFDVALGIEHKANKQGYKYLTRVREYMPKKHAQFIEALGDKPSIREYVLSSNDERLKEIYSKAVQALVDFRNYHLQIVKTFILDPADNHNAAERGTGGTVLLPFLGGLRDTTAQSIPN